MNWDAIGAVGEVLGALVVVASVLYLGRQVSQTNRIARTSVSREYQNRYGELYQWIATDPSITSLAAKLRDPEYRARTGEEEEKVEHFCSTFANIWLGTAAAYNQGLMDESLYRLYIQDVQVKLDQWPAMNYYMKKVCAKWPDMKQFEIFQALYEE